MPRPSGFLRASPPQPPLTPGVTLAASLRFSGAWASLLVLACSSLAGVVGGAVSAVGVVVVAREVLGAALLLSLWLPAWQGRRLRLVAAALAAELGLVAGLSGRGLVQRALRWWGIACALAAVPLAVDVGLLAGHADVLDGLFGLIVPWAVQSQGRDSAASCEAARLASASGRQDARIGARAASAAPGRRTHAEGCQADGGRPSFRAGSKQRPGARGLSAAGDTGVSARGARAWRGGMALLRRGRAVAALAVPSLAAIVAAARRAASVAAVCSSRARRWRGTRVAAPHEATTAIASPPGAADSARRSAGDGCGVRVALAAPSPGVGEARRSGIRGCMGAPPSLPAPVGARRSLGRPLKENAPLAVKERCPRAQRPVLAERRPQGLRQAKAPLAVASGAFCVFVDEEFAWPEPSRCRESEPEAEAEIGAPEAEIEAGHEAAALALKRRLESLRALRGPWAAGDTEAVLDVLQSSGPLSESGARVAHRPAWSKAAIARLSERLDTQLGRDEGPHRLLAGALLQLSAASPHRP